MAKSLPERRGFEIEEFGGSTAFLLARADIGAVSPILAELMGGVLDTDVYGKPREHTGELAVLHQYRGHPWTLACLDVCQEELVQALSRQLNTACIYFQYEDTSCWRGYLLFEGGKRAEEYTFGPDYREALDADEETGQGESVTCWDIDVSNDDGTQYLFFSSKRTVPVIQVHRSKPFLKQFFRAQDAWLPDWHYLPYADTAFTAPSLTPKDLVRVDVINDAG